MSDQSVKAYEMPLHSVINTLHLYAEFRKMNLYKHITEGQFQYRSDNMSNENPSHAALTHTYMIKVAI
jgi:hypothetical protein